MNTLQSADVQPTANQLAAIASAQQAAAGVMARFAAFKDLDLAAINVKLKAAGLAIISLPKE
jgi:hypothetical protein